MTKPQFTNEQIDRISEVLGNLGIAFTASAIIPSIIGKFQPYVIIASVILTIVSWYLSIKIIKP